MTSAASSAKPGRIEALDWARGLALIAMAAYHTLWDLSFYGFIDIGIGVSPLWIAIQRGILTVFLLIAGASLQLAHGNAIRWPSFWRRWAMIAAGALAVTLGTYLLLPDYVAYFGVLHAIALFSLLALPFLRAPLWLVLAVAAAVLAVALYQNPAFDSRELSWIGFFTSTPSTTDLVPVVPWFGVMLLGMAGLRIAAQTKWLDAARHWRFAAPPSRILKLLGRWSLVFYLLHQPLLIGIIYPLSLMRPDPIQVRADEFTQSCRASCSADEKFCTAYCECALDIVTRDDLWFAVDADPRSVEQERSVNQMASLCAAMAGN
ncbi:MAG TPA: heparan-alpha-glucosaminide N-acetyltransferase [Devosia sp.]|nr:heparan-alpha-glucosaminide N-acetyltransferase [Devosia sp.]